MMMHLPWLGTVRQIGYLVPDLDAAVGHWLEHMGIGPWTCYRNVTLRGQYRGEPTLVRMHVALAYQGDMQMELIQVLTDTPSPYRDDSGRPLQGIHHIAWLSDDFEADVARARKRGLSVCFRGGNGAMEVAYLACPDQPGTLLELIEGTADMKGMMEQGIAEARRWDGSDPVRNIDFALPEGEGGQ